MVEPAALGATTRGQSTEHIGIRDKFPEND